MTLPILEKMADPQATAVEPSVRENASESWESKYFDARADIFRMKTDTVGTAEYQSGALLPSLDGRAIDVSARRLYRADDHLSPPRKLEVLQEWEGEVETVDKRKEEFIAVVRDVTTPSHPEEEVTLSMSEVSSSDHDLLLPCAVFYWTIGYETTEWGQIKRFSQIRFRRLPCLSEVDQGRATDAARRLAQAFGIPGETGAGDCDGDGGSRHSTR